jgi:hypothetical protein
MIKPRKISPEQEKYEKLRKCEKLRKHQICGKYRKHQITKKRLENPIP